MVNTYPCNPFPISSEQLHKGDNEDLQAQINAIKDGSVIDSFGDVETALTAKADNDIIAPEFDAEAGTYDIGDLVMYEGKLYEFTSAHETAGEWDSTEVTEKTVADEIGTVKSGLNDVNSNIARNMETFALVENVTAIRSSLTKSACVCELCGLYQKTLTLDSWNKIGDVPNGYKPVAESRFIAQNNTLSKWMLGKMDTDGGVYVYPTADDSQAASTNVLIHQVYMA